MPYLENACCNDENGNVYDYFLKNNSNNKIKNLNENVRVASEVLEKLKTFLHLKYFSVMLIQKIHQPLLVIQLLEETIYRAFIKYCKYNTGLTLDDELAGICKKIQLLLTN